MLGRRRKFLEANRYMSDSAFVLIHDIPEVYPQILRWSGKEVGVVITVVNCITVVIKSTVLELSTFQISHFSEYLF